MLFGYRYMKHDQICDETVEQILIRGKTNVHVHVSINWISATSFGWAEHMHIYTNPISVLFVWGPKRIFFMILYEKEFHLTKQIVN